MRRTTPHERAVCDRLNADEFTGAMLGYLFDGMKCLLEDIEHLSKGEQPHLEAKASIRLAGELWERVSKEVGR